MKYIVHKRFKNTALCGAVNLQAMTTCESYEDIIVCNGMPICFAQSENAHQYFAVNDDGTGMLRGKLTQAIQKTLAKRDNNYQARWNKVWDDPLCQKYKRYTHEDHWLWSHEFFMADIETLKHIAELIGINTKNIH